MNISRLQQDEIAIRRTNEAAPTPASMPTAVATHKEAVAIAKVQTG